MGLDLDVWELPAILVITDDDKPIREHGCIRGRWEIELQLIHKQVPDSTMDQFVRDVCKAIFANSPTAQRVDAFKGPPPAGIHASVYNIGLLSIVTDLNMIEANRFYGVTLLVEYSTKLYNL
jgi:hypothetical protein